MKRVFVMMFLGLLVVAVSSIQSLAACGCNEDCDIVCEDQILFPAGRGNCYVTYYDRCYYVEGRCGPPYDCGLDCQIGATWKIYECNPLGGGWIECEAFCAEFDICLF